MVSARTGLDDFEDRFGITVPREGYDTLGGFIIHLLGKVPKKGEEIFHEGLLIRIIGGDQKRITRVLVVPQRGEESDSPPAPLEPGS